jgi:histidinol phosphatase-like enzyme
MNKKLAKAEMKVREAYQKYVKASQECAKVKNKLVEEFLKLFINDIEKLPIIENKHDIIITYQLNDKLKEVLTETFETLYVEDYVRSLDISISSNTKKIKVFYHNKEK